MKPLEPIPPRPPADYWENRLLREHRRVRFRTDVRKLDMWIGFIFTVTASVVTTLAAVAFVGLCWWAIIAWR